MKPELSVVIAWAAVSWTFSSIAYAQSPQPAASTNGHRLVLHGEAAALVAIKSLVAEGRWKDALDLIAHLPASLRLRPDYVYVRAQLLRKVGERREAIDLYNRLLSRDESQQLIRLELAQTYFEIHDDRAAEQYFRLALSGKLTPSDSAQVHAYLKAIRKRSDWRVAASASLAPDSNVNAATSAQTVQLFGLPFQVSRQDHEQSSWNASTSLLIDRSVPLFGPLRLEGQAYGSWLDNFSAHQFDQSALGARAGPQWVCGENTLSLLGGVERLRYGGTVLYDQESLTARADLPVTPTVLYRLTLAEQHFTYPAYGSFNGWATTAAVERTQFLDPASFWRLTLTGIDDAAAANYQTYRGLQVAVGYYHTLPWGLAAYVEPSVGVDGYPALQPLFNVKRTDIIAGLTARLILRDHTFWGFAPFAGAQLLHVKSSIGLYSYDRARLEGGVARTF